MACSWHVHDLFIAGSWLDHFLLRNSLPFVKDLFMTCSQHDHNLSYLFKSWSKLFYILYMTSFENSFMACIWHMTWSWLLAYSLIIHFFFISCPWLVHNFFVICLWLGHVLLMTLYWVSHFPYQTLFGCSKLIPRLLPLALNSCRKGGNHSLSSMNTCKMCLWNL